eukprot:scaffold1483_cov374-Pavlova_lutheri.AAC.10
MSNPCRMYENRFPDVDDVVMVQVRPGTERLGDALGKGKREEEEPKHQRTWKDTTATPHVGGGGNRRGLDQGMGTIEERRFQRRTNGRNGGSNADAMHDVHSHECAKRRRPLGRR